MKGTNVSEVHTFLTSKNWEFICEEVGQVAIKRKYLGPEGQCLNIAAIKETGEIYALSQSKQLTCPTAMEKIGVHE
ncbi:hypothetical protein ES703_41350 [subsurface metagenome]